MKFGYGSDIITTGLTVQKRWTIEDYLREIADIGYDCASLFCWRGLQAQPQYLKSEDRKQILSLLDEINITISLIGGYGGLMLTTDYGYFSHDKSEREYVKSYMKQCVDLAVDLKCDVVGEISSIKPSYMKEEKAWEILETELGEVCDYAQENRVNIALEPGMRVLDIFIYSAQSFLEIKKRIKSNALKCDYDPSNMIIGGEKNVLEDIKLIKNDVVDVALKGVKQGVMTNNMEFTRPNSELDCTEQEQFLTILKQIGYDGAISIEELQGLYTVPMDIDLFESAKLCYSDIGRILDKIDYQRQK